jgi:hypothetical protein
MSIVSQKSGSDLASICHIWNKNVCGSLCVSCIWCQSYAIAVQGPESMLKFAATSSLIWWKLLYVLCFFFFQTSRFQLKVVPTSDARWSTSGNTSWPIKSQAGKSAPPKPPFLTLLYFQGAMNVSLYSKDGW